MLCCYCQKNEAATKYIQKVNGKVIEKNYCFDCARLLSREQEEIITDCPYCGTSVEEFQTTKLVGCAYCYQTLKDVVLPVCQKMQGKKTHRGKFPTLETDDELLNITFEGANEKNIEKTRIERQSRELSLIIEKLISEGKYKQAKDYADKLSLMKSQGKIKEDFVWSLHSEI